MNHAKCVSAAKQALPEPGPTTRGGRTAQHGRPALLWRLIDWNLSRPRGGILVGPARAGMGFWPLNLADARQCLIHPALMSRSNPLLDELVKLGELDRDSLSDFQDVVSKALIWARRRQILVDDSEQEQFLVLIRDGANTPQKFSSNALAPVRWLDRNQMNHHDVFADGLTYVKTVEPMSESASPLKIGARPRGTHHLLAVVNQPCGYDVRTVRIPVQDWQRLCRAVVDVSAEQVVHAVTLIIRGDRYVAQAHGPNPSGTVPDGESA